MNTNAKNKVIQSCKMALNKHFNFLYLSLEIRQFIKKDVNIINAEQQNDTTANIICPPV